MRTNTATTTVVHIVFPHHVNLFWRRSGRFSEVRHLRDALTCQYAACCRSTRRTPWITWAWCDRHRRPCTRPVAVPDMRHLLPDSERHDNGSLCRRGELRGRRAGSRRPGRTLAAATAARSLTASRIGPVPLARPGSGRQFRHRPEGDAEVAERCPVHYRRAAGSHRRLVAVVATGCWQMMNKTRDAGH